jgi:hypothetical protein
MSTKKSSLDAVILIRILVSNSTYCFSLAQAILSDATSRGGPVHLGWLGRDSDKKVLHTQSFYFILFNEKNDQSKKPMMDLTLVNI